MERCDECDFVYDEAKLRPLHGMLAAVGGVYREVLAGDPSVLRRRRDETTWSPLEYGCHVRDVLLAQRERVLTALVEDQPAFAPMYRDDRVSLARYNDEDPSQVASEIEMAAGLLARQFAVLDDGQLARECIYRYPTVALRSIRWVGVHTLHECRHHVLDIERGLKA